jgi:hypothetical protein
MVNLRKPSLFRVAGYFVKTILYLRSVVLRGTIVFSKLAKLMRINYEYINRKTQ